MGCCKIVDDNFDLFGFAVFFVYTAIFPSIVTCSAWRGGTTEDPWKPMCTTMCEPNCTTVCNRVYNHGFCRPVDLLHIARSKSTHISFLSTHFNVTTYEAIPTHVPWNASDYATVVFVIAVLIVVIVIIQKGIEHWDSIVLYCKPYCTFEYAKNMILCVTCLATILLSEPRLLEPRKWLSESGAV